MFILHTMRTISFLLFLAGLALPLRGQEEKMSVRTLAITPGEFPEIWAMDASKAVKVEFSDIQPSEGLQVNRGASLALFQGGLDEKGKPKDAAPVTVKVPGTGNVLLLGWIQAGKPKFLALPDATVSGKFNQWLVVNMTQKNVGIQVGTPPKSTSFAPVSSKVLDVDHPAGKGIPIVMASKEDKTWNKFFSTYWPVHDDKRCLVLLVQIGDKIEARQIFEDLSRAKKTAE